ncbi:MAG: hypothetical protein KJO31_00660 [Gammaproteobacteria bacterium]|nr:hypothetical protein [Gammaproteobacteria bacterium]
MTTMTPRTGDRRRQQGAALLLLMLVVVVAASAVLVNRLNNDAAKLLRRTSTQAVLADAKAALLEYAATYPDRFPGEPYQLPCPDLDGAGGTLDGESHTANCGARGVTMLGRVPWRTLGLPVPLDGTGECLWYAVSGEHKSAGATTRELINSDTYGLLQLFARDDGSLVEGLSAETRPVAILLAPQAPLSGQSRPAAAGQQCSSNFASGDYLDLDSVTGISNATVAATADTLSEFVVTPTQNDELNDQVLTIGGREFAASIFRRHDFAARMDGLANLVTQCVANYAAQNPGGPDDKRLPFPAPVALADYRPDSNYDDVDAGVLSGRLPDIVDDSNVLTGNPVARVISDCNSLAVPGWTPELHRQWQHWKDHFFITVSASFGPSAATPSACTECLTVNGSGQYAAIVFFAGIPLTTAGQRRTVPPLDADARASIANYLESSNASNHPYSTGIVDYAMQAASPTFNDALYCVDESLAVVAC